ncbi:MAG: 1-(5-phosphoribosyl)-5-[(5-phosphoribosylamino)methylideneamino]imidazole-4-carboxamide isomerase [Dehalococcoidia bacterium]
MEIIPAVDLRNGKCVRLYQGDYSKETLYADDPVSMALRWQEEGAGRMHLVDLDGAAEGSLRNLPVIEKIVEELNFPVQVGGGIREIQAIRDLTGLGVDRAILGTVALEEPELVREACQEFGERIVISIDARDGYVRGRGWVEEGKVPVEAVIRRMEEAGARRFIYTDISRDGTLTEPNFTEIENFRAMTMLPVIAAGGVTKVEHIERLAGLGVEGAIVGRALYTGDIDLREALRAIAP